MSDDSERAALRVALTTMVREANGTATTLKALRALQTSGDGQAASALCDALREAH